jgi:hypothetical protein
MILKNQYGHVRRRLPMTLIEVLVVVALLALVFSTTGFFVYRGIVKEKFLSDGHLILNKMQAARGLAVQMDMEVRLKLLQNEQGTLWSLEGDKPLMNGLKVMSKSQKRLKGIKSMALGSQLIPLIEIVFSRMGSVSLTDDLSLFPVRHPGIDDEEKLVISCYPFPHLVFTHTLESKKDPAEEIPFPKEVLTLE